MRKILSVFLAMIMVLSVVACGSKDTDPNETGSDQAETIILGKHTAVFKGYTLTKDDEGNDAMVLTYDYTNGGKDEQSFAWAFLFVATQAGEELGSPMFDEDGNQITKNYEENVQKGQMREVAIALTLVNTTDNVTIVFSDLDNHEYTQTVKLSGSDGKDSSLEETGPEEAGSYKLYEMTFEGETFDNIFLESAGMDTLYTMDLAADGTGVLKLDEDESPVTWKDGKITVTASGAVYTYEFKDGMITLTETTGDIMVFQKTGAAGGSVLDKIKGNQGGGTQVTSQDYWSGDWYGWWHVTSANGHWENLKDCWYDCCARIEKYDESSGYIEIWDEEGSGADKYMAESSVSFGMGTTDDGAMMSEDGNFWDCAIEHADWIVDPGASVVSQYDHMICIDGTYEDPENDGGFNYKIYLRPWGMDWADVAADDEEMLPYSYETWYLPAIQSGTSMPDVIGGDYGGLAPGEVPDSQMEGQGGEMNDPNASAVDGTWQAPIYGDYGLSKANATGIVPLTRDELADRIGFYADSQIGSAPYDSLYNTMGNYIHGKPMIDDSRWDTGKTHVYQWSIESGEYATLVFEVTNYSAGIEILQSVETSPGLLD